MNVCFHIGNLTRDPETKVMQKNGKERCTFTLAVNRDYKVNDTYGSDFIMFTAYREMAQRCQKYLFKGKKVAVTSHVRTSSYDKDGKRIYTTEFVVDKIEFLSSKDRAVSNQAESSMPPAYGSDADAFMPADDDFPF